ncbi:hypothetical protein I3J27_13325 [Bradyrhizobium xenonodulans]|uniref:Uncharacterized protein n=1 Tax=Bradyrhizobium xenonodulans TaxID=2736875 RepID=A0ABY7MSF5_9BRAD|nr:hypothetical protein [Bradyrhizobium xenonodulans]WBL81351.1 hypothetical protein I3J27_13325 [Bradyrhizobium xenonodulans]
MMTRLLPVAFLAIVVSTCSAVPALIAAEVVRDEATGLTVTPPDGYAVQREEPPAVHAAVRFAIRKPLDPPSTGCTVEAQLLPAIDSADRGLARTLSARSQQGKTSWRDKALLQIMSSVLVQASRPFSQDGIEALQVDGWPREATDASGSKVDRTMQVRIVVLKLDNGYVNVTCRAGTAAFPARRAEFEQVVRGVKTSR